MSTGMSGSSSLQISLLGPLDIRVNGEPIAPIRSRKEQWLLALLVLRSDRNVTREWLAETLWPDNELSEALAYLRRAVYMLRQALAGEAHRITGEGARSLRLEISSMEIDLLAFDAAIRQGDPASLKRAIDLYRGPVLEGCDEEWIQGERQVREQAFENALERYASHERETGNLSGAVDCLQRLILHDPLRESAHRSLMEAHAESGDLSAMISCYRDLRLMLRRQINAEPDPATVQLYEELRSDRRRSPQRGQLPLRTTATEYDRKQPATKAHAQRALPRPLTRLIGREAELDEIASALASSRLVTLTGAGGVGKTRLAIELAERKQAEFRDGLCYVDLSALTDGHLVPHAIALAAGMEKRTDPSVFQALIDYLENRQMLIVLDNSEHVISYSATAADEILRSCWEVQILATSQQPMGVMGEIVWRTPSLALPDLGPGDTFDLTPEQTFGYAGVRLFVERAHSCRPDFQLTPRNSRKVVELCRRLDGIPLAIELAAARMAVLTVDQIAAKLNDRFHLLTLGSRTAIPRQQTLRAAMDWSYDLLDEAEQQMLQRLGVFAGGGTLDAIEELCRDDCALADNAMDLIQQLVLKSFVWTSSIDGVNRYRLLETTREYAVEKLVESGLSGEIRTRHGRMFARQMVEARDTLGTDRAAIGWSWIESEADNVRASLEWLLRADATAEEIELSHDLIARRMSQLWQGRSHLSESLHWHERALERDSSQTPSWSMLSMSAGYTALKMGNAEAARKHFENGAAISRALGREIDILRSNNAFGKLAEFLGDTAQARMYYQRCYDGFEAMGDTGGMCSACNNLGAVALYEGDYIAARTYHQHCLAIGRDSGSPTMVAWSLDNLAEVNLAEGDLPSARRLFKESLEQFVRVDFRPGAADCVQGMAEATCGSSEDVEGARRTARLLGAADRMRQIYGLVVSPLEMPVFENAVNLARGALGDDAFDLEWQAGSSMHYDEAIAYALQTDDTAIP